MPGDVLANPQTMMSETSDCYYAVCMWEWVYDLASAGNGGAGRLQYEGQRPCSRTGL